ncbi:tlde1 domain-containing protein [Cronobacter dublinensis]|uniref:tlde1 domain-containing protein n=1 Tax=Cronobacter dublinensis TaxID=413497 RepID=UPI00057758D3|nr:tlde1 domain-containing protein [Cronobacter dublinensis]EGT5660680.1 DUF2778 domain-containing protein [Cronobacter dublinensis subsp. dublinensis]EGT5667337.1 DUF2778 domain-containing protein [Cronobacter dublinensis subsp. dublinensis]EGT5673303.1 DUF2778 domain-containing protein [Cronobacter dublinensis subsp. dublinensis]EGT5677523.1 DUF2778 domain-containing protein [Cronobacter dublinensis subsp. dublinensis]EGT5685815.1 DUF2778 domain-containing protein [Cronobacter dublinensis su
MTWIYHQSSGKLFRNGKLMGTGYAGKDAGKNAPDLQGTADIGPLPRGKYTIGAPFHHPHTGNYSMRLTPAASNHMFGRSGFLIHGDSTAHPGEASNGCIIMPLNVRHAIWSSGDRHLEVVQ